MIVKRQIVSDKIGSLKGNSPDQKIKVPNKLPSILWMVIQHKKLCGKLSIINIC